MTTTDRALPPELEAKARRVYRDGRLVAEWHEADYRWGPNQAYWQDLDYCGECGTRLGLHQGYCSAIKKLPPSTGSES